MISGTILLTLGLLFSVLGGWQIYLGWYDYQQLQAGYQNCVASHVAEPCDHILFGTLGSQIMEGFGILLLVIGIPLILLGIHSSYSTKRTVRRTL
jgi:hypothetical protein